MKRPPHLFFAVFLFVALMLFHTGCMELSGPAFQSVPNNELRDALKDKGIMRLDPSNPYLAAAQLLNTEKKVSESLQGFLSIRGEPTALEVEKDKSARFILKLYYTDLFERYELTATESDWVIAGPFPDQSVPRLFNAAETPTSEATRAASIKTPFPTPTAAFKFWGTPAPSPMPEPTVPIMPAVTPADNVADTSLSSDLAETSPRGDVVHYVTFPGETISIISRWYTGERENAAKIARLNRMKNADALQIGDSIVIPSYMVKNKSRMNEAGLQKVQSDIAAGK